MDSEPSMAVTAAAVAVTRDLALQVYRDAIQPTAIEAGKLLSLLPRTGRAMLRPVEMWCNKNEHTVRQFTEDLESRASSIPDDRLNSPPLQLVAGAVEGYSYSVDNEELRRLYINLLGTALDSDTTSSAHPAFVGLLSQLCPDEARILRVLVDNDSFPCVSIRRVSSQEHGIVEELLRCFSLVPYQAGCEWPENGPFYLDNLCRLGIIEFPGAGNLHFSTKMYQEVQDHPAFTERLRSTRGAEVWPGIVRLTAFGKMFIRACVADTSPGGSPTVEAAEPGAL